ncbi:MAG: hypothetical protein NWQ82_03995 [Solirubrobacteraceae bacterium]|jgi:hypothetical protein|nr:hypothetical protein [Solirubrobacteraceae bacterium]MDP4673130.1 hypothetical protein [Solirubrobacteraceae bacterium]MDP4921112.1 hypothetical protein [Solirubrobacteraceae bacterium]
MRDSDTPNSEVRSITLPSGRQVEISYLDGEAVALADQGLEIIEVEADLQESVDQLLNCGECGCDTVQPVEWDGYGPRHWRIELRCPNCEARCTTIVEDDVAELCDRAHQRGADELELALTKLAEENGKRDIERLRAALEKNHLLPEDF